MSSRKCAFCGGTPVTREHGWPKWLENVLPNKAIRHTEISDDYDFVPQPRGIRSSIAGAEVRRICKSCNNGWMSKIEAAVQPIIGPMIQGQEIHLSQSDQMTVATWIVKTCYVLALAYSARKQIEQAYRDFFEQRSPSSQNHVATAAFVGDQKLTTAFHFQPLVLTKTDHGQPIIINTPSIYVMTMAVGNFIGQVIYTKLPARFSVKGNRLRELWPYEGDFIWTPTPSYNAIEFQQLARTGFPTLDPHPQSAKLKWTDI